MKTTLSETRLVTKFAFANTPRGRKRANGALRALRGWSADGPSALEDKTARDDLLNAMAMQWGPQVRELSVDTLLALLESHVR